MTACSWPGVKLSKMSLGSTRTGRKTPKTPGSRRVGEDITRIGIASCRGEPTRTAAWIRRQRTHHEQAIPRNPHAHMLNTIAGNGLAAGGTAGKADESAGPVNGRLISSTMTDRLRDVFSGRVRHRISPPRVMSTETGMRNLYEEHNLAQWRTRAGL